jgi:hypothetical protein
MKRSARIYSWIIISIILQIAIFVYFNNYFFGSKSDITATSIDVTDKPQNNKSISLAQGATDIKVSYDGSYVSYYLNNNLVVYDVTAKKEVKTISADNKEFTFYKWLPDRNMVMYAVCPPNGQKGEIRISTYDFDIESDQLRDYPGLTTLPRGSRIESVELSPQTNVVYFKVKTSNANASIYKFNVMNNLSYVMSTSSKTLIKETAYVEKLVYQDARNRIYIRDGANGTVNQLPIKSEAALLSIDSEDNIYVGKLDKSGMITDIYYGAVGNSFSSWTSVSLKKAVRAEDVFIKQSGAIFEVDENTKTMYAISSGNQNIKYTGKLIDILEDYIVTTDGNNVLLKALKISDPAKK